MSADETPEFDTSAETLQSAWATLADVQSTLGKYLVHEGEAAVYAGAVTESERQRLREISDFVDELAYDIQDRQYGTDLFGLSDDAPDHVSTWAREHGLGPYAADDEGGDGQ